MHSVVTVDVAGGTISSRLLTADEVAQREANTAIVHAQEAARVAFHEQIVTLAQSAVGVRLQDLTQAHNEALVAVLLYKAGGVDSTTLQILPLDRWVSA